VTDADSRSFKSSRLFQKFKNLKFKRWPQFGAFSKQNHTKMRTNRCCQLCERELNVTLHLHSLRSGRFKIQTITCKFTYSIFVFHNFSLRSRWGHPKEIWIWRFQRFTLHHGKWTDFIKYLGNCYYSICLTIGRGRISA